MNPHYGASPAGFGSSVPHAAYGQAQHYSTVQQQGAYPQSQPTSAAMYGAQGGGPYAIHPQQHAHSAQQFHNASSAQTAFSPQANSLPVHSFPHPSQSLGLSAPPQYSGPQSYAAAPSPTTWAGTSPTVPAGMYGARPQTSSGMHAGVQGQQHMSSGSVAPGGGPGTVNHQYTGSSSGAVSPAKGPVTQASPPSSFPCPPAASTPQKQLPRARWMPKTNMECRYYDELFALADPNQSGHIKGREAVQFLSKCKLEKSILRTIWTVADVTKQNQLRKQDFYVALRLISMAQNGEDVSEQQLLALGNTPLPMPQLEDVPPPPEILARLSKPKSKPKPSSPDSLRSVGGSEATAVMGSASAAGVSASSNVDATSTVPTLLNASPPTANDASPMSTNGQAGHGNLTPSSSAAAAAAAASAAQTRSVGSASASQLQGGFPQQQSPGPYVMGPDDVERYTSFFEQVNRANKPSISIETAKFAFSQSGLDQQGLEQVCRLADVNRDNHLTRSEFCLAMHLIICQTRRKLPVPTTLPSYLRQLATAQTQKHIASSAQSPAVTCESDTNPDFKAQEGRQATAASLTQAQHLGSEPPPAQPPVTSSTASPELCRIPLPSSSSVSTHSTPSTTSAHTSTSSSPSTLAAAPLSTSLLPASATLSTPIAPASSATSSHPLASPTLPKVADLNNTHLPPDSSPQKSTSESLPLSKPTAAVKSNGMAGMSMLPTASSYEFQSSLSQLQQHETNEKNQSRGLETGSLETNFDSSFPKEYSETTQQQSHVAGVAPPVSATFESSGTSIPMASTLPPTMSASFPSNSTAVVNASTMSSDERQSYEAQIEMLKKQKEAERIKYIEQKKEMEKVNAQAAEALELIAQLQLLDREQQQAAARVKEAKEANEVEAEELKELRDLQTQIVQAMMQKMELMESPESTQEDL